ncbi:MAG TPA: GNAT family N-acetyltransferase [Rhodocyclaceae bacterium]|nr:GNAT family N-acetyltransferase [Rhodocyclaceae bacterium]
MAVRLATVDDAGAIAAVHIAAWRAAYAGLMPQAVLDGLSVEKRTADWRRSLSITGPDMTSVVTNAADVVVGFAHYGLARGATYVGKRHGELFAINLQPDVWRCGFGRQLCEQVLAYAAARQWHFLSLWVLRENIRARAFYEGLGFIADGGEQTDSTLIGAPLNELRYRKQLASGGVRLP